MIILGQDLKMVINGHKIKRFPVGTPDFCILCDNFCGFPETVHQLCVEFKDLRILVIIGRFKSHLDELWIPDGKTVAAGRVQEASGEEKPRERGFKYPPPKTNGPKHQFFGGFQPLVGFFGVYPTEKHISCCID